jgi:hypothetical protein
MTILGLLSSMVLFALASAQESARVAKTETTINKLNALIMAKYDSYRTRRVPISIPAGTIPRAAAAARLDALHDLMRMEMPDRFTDIPDKTNNKDMPVTHTIPGNNGSPLIPIPSVAVKYRKLLDQATKKTPQFASAECLYLIVTVGLDDPDVLEQFAPDEIGDTDGDGLLEFLDGWGRPIDFLRWAPGFTSPMHNWNLNPAKGPVVYPTAHDPFDPMHIYRPAQGEPFYDPAKPKEQQVYPPLYPLIYSAGPDHINDIYDDAVSPPFEYSKVNNNPYAVVAGSMLGTPMDLDSALGPADGDDNSIDNITNHNIGVQ